MGMLTTTFLALVTLQEGVSFEEKLLGTLPEEMETHDIVFSSKGTAVAFAAGIGKRWFVHVNKWKSEAFDSVVKDSLRFSPAGDTVAYTVRQGNRTPMFLGDKKGEFDAVTTARFSPDGKHMAYGAAVKNGECVVHDGKPGMEFEGLSSWSPTIGPDGTLAYAGVKAKKWYVVIGDKVSEPLEGLGAKGVVFSPDGKKAAYLVFADKKWFIVAGTKRSGPYDNVGYPVYSPDGTRVAVNATEGAAEFIMVDDKKLQTFDRVGIPVFSPDGKLVAYAANRGGRYDVKGKFSGGRWRIVCGDTESEEFDDVSMPVFEPGGKTVAYDGTSGDTVAMIIGGKKGLPFDGVGSMGVTFSADGKHSAYMARTGGQWFMVVDGEKSEPFDAIIKAGAIFSPDGKAVAYIARAKEQAFMMIGKKRIDPSFRPTTKPVFSADGKKLAFGATKGRELWWKVVDVP